ncbi:uncharacterized protein LOC121867473 [Homarus americanus]|uniref:Uncharacterized protein n=1 Tax=Homarus americanus TaxID=6706 RepID=A0A8J5K7U5_HOMAM|nr:uncharacterized protein LOC121867473 [Homarus americanus]KAG7168148.1 hypothetical protein Hamer_G016779 [Homarus americanus]
MDIIKPLFVLLFYISSVRAAPISGPRTHLTGPGSQDGCVNLAAPKILMCLEMEDAKDLSFYNLTCHFGPNSQLVYNCSSDTNCEGQGVLKGATYPPEVNPNCHGLPFTNINGDHMGTYICRISTDRQSYLVTHNLQPCPGSHKEEDSTPTPTTDQPQPGVVRLSIIIVSAVVIALLIFYFCHRQSSSANI